MPSGICKLCREEKEFRLSHFMPAALYPKHVKTEMDFALPGGGVTKHGQEMTAYALCGECEMRFDQGGESEVLDAIAPKAIKKYPLNERLRLAVPRDDF